MSNAKTIGLVSSHIVFGIIGFLLATRDSDSTPELSPVAPPLITGHFDRSLPSDRPSVSADSFRALQDWRGSEHDRAWNAIRYAKLNADDRIMIQRQLLKSWAMVDLAAAMRVALDEAWDYDELRNYRRDGPFIDVFSDAFSQNPEEAWNLICHGGFGIGARLLRNVWIESVGQKKPLLLASIFKDLSQSDRDKAVNVCLAGCSYHKDKTIFKQVFEQLLSLPAEIITAKQLAAFLFSSSQSLSLTELLDELIKSEHNDDRLACAQAAVIGKLLSLKDNDEIAATIADLPGKLRQEVLCSTITTGYRGEKITGLFDLLIAESAWDKLKDRELGSKLHMASMGCNAQLVADWVITIPYREEITPLFHRGIENHIRYNMEASKEWIATIPSQKWRDRAYAEYSQQALNAKNDAAASRWALDQIQDSTFKVEAEGWRMTWEKQNTSMNN
jgi:hypothetical protein